MTTSPLRQLLELVEPDRETWWIPGRGAVCAGDIRRLLAAHAELARCAAGRRVAVWARSERALAPLLVLLDGAAAQLTLLPDHLTEDQRARIVSRSSSDLLVTTDPAAVRAASTATCEVRQVEVESFWAGADSHRVGEGEGSGAPRNTRWVLPTSGTTGEPKLVAHTLRSLTRTVKRDLTRGRQYRWGSLYHLTGFAGLQVFLQSWWGGSCLILADRETDLAERVEQLAAGGCTALSATPTMWRKLLMSSSIDRLALRRITLGGEIVDQQILDALRHAFPAAKIVHIYASTEAGVGWAVRDGRAGFPAALLDDPPPGVELAVDAGGHLLIRGAESDQKYLGDAEPLQGADGFIDTGDLVARDGDRFLFLGRENGTINVGGNKVHPEQVERVLLGFPGVRMARATSRRSAVTGALVQAEVVADPACLADPDAWRKSLVAHCRARLEPYQVPAVVRLVPSLEVSDSGKLKRED